VGACRLINKAIDVLFIDYTIGKVILGYNIE